MFFVYFSGIGSAVYFNRLPIALLYFSAISASKSAIRSRASAIRLKTAIISSPLSFPSVYMIAQDTRKVNIFTSKILHKKVRLILYKLTKRILYIYYSMS
uniref:Uncharacterized protein n=1 Tax=Siphoviridae sp. ctKcB20 TaxID=2827568 RepID=A0A8S5LLB2_9CAUD|nr:MAG TPA: hypothetical protein [Siphoviridae sp. ctKcB20]